MPEATGLKVL